MRGISQSEAARRFRQFGCARRGNAGRRGTCGRDPGAHPASPSPCPPRRIFPHARDTGFPISSAQCENRAARPFSPCPPGGRRFPDCFCGLSGAECPGAASKLPALGRRRSLCATKRGECGRAPAAPDLRSAVPGSLPGLPLAHGARRGLPTQARCPGSDGARRRDAAPRIGRPIGGLRGGPP